MSRTARDREGDLSDDLDRSGAPEPAASARFLGRVFNGGALPTAPERYYLVRPVTPGGLESEGAAPSLGLESEGVVPVIVLGDPPSVGDLLPCKSCGGRWVAENRGAGRRGINLFGCPCTAIPPTLRMSVNDPALNFGMFQPCTFTFGPIPPEFLPLAVGTSGYLSDGTFTDRGSSDVFRYWFTCYFGYYSLGRLYARSVMGSPFRDMFRYTWLIGIGPRPELGYVYGNTCSPFVLGHGTVFPGGDVNSIVTIASV